MNKKNKIILTSVAIIIAIGGGIFFISKTKETSNINNEEDSKNSSLVQELVTPSEESLEIENISGFIPGVEVSDKDEVSETEVGGLKLPYNVPNTSMVIESIGQYTGPFVEDGSDDPKANVVSMVVKNNSNKLLQYGEIHIKINNKDAVFKVSTLPAKTSALVLESTGSIEFNSEDKLNYNTSLESMLDEYSLMEDKVEIKKDDGKLTIKNKTNENLGTVYVYYKYMQSGGAYLGGITYRTKFENVQSGKNLEVETKHFSPKGSQIIMVDIIN